MNLKEWIFTTVLLLIILIIVIVILRQNRIIKRLPFQCKISVIKREYGYIRDSEPRELNEKQFGTFIRQNYQEVSPYDFNSNKHYIHLETHDGLENEHRYFLYEKRETEEITMEKLSKLIDEVVSERKRTHPLNPKQKKENENGK